ncbi:hypothetical protein GJAV_G00237580 [Gymnothorax javanicus]|nr:hypothetical protein GJAV_G00237580 [Gymnothorax javanicus]
MEFERLTNQGIIEPVKFSEWAAPIVPVLNPDNSVRICGDYKVTVNLVSKLEQYPIPKLEDLFEKLSGGEKLSKLDLSHAYQQVTLDEASKPYVTLKTHKGLFQVNRLPFGVSSSPAIFQRMMEGLMAGIPNVAVYLDDILVTGSTNQVLARLKEAGLRLKRNKCAFMEPEAEFLGHKVDASGMHPLPHKVKAIQEAPAPTNVTELRAYLGLLNYYNRFLPNMSTLLSPLHELLRKEIKWEWEAEQQRAFEKSKRLMQSSGVLVHYASQKDLILSCDTSPYGVGAVLSHPMPDGQERPISFMSTTLTAAEANYSQLDKEGLAVMFGIQRYHKYLYGRKFVICTDHKPLLSLFNEMKAVPQIASPCIQRWALTLRAYEYEIIYKPGKHHCNADALSRLPLAHQPAKKEREERVPMMENVTLVSAAEMRKWTSRDPVLSRVAEFTQHGWPPQDPDPAFQPFESTTGRSPAEMLQGRKLRSTQDHIHPDRRTWVERKQNIQKKHHDRKVTGRSFQEGDAVITKNFSHGPKWIPGVITKITGPVSYKVMLGDGNIVRRHVDQIRARPECNGVRNLEVPDVPVYSVKAHKDIVNSIDGVGGLGIGVGAPEIVTGSRDGTVKVWDSRQKDTPVATMEPVEGETRRDCWTVAFGHAFNDQDRCVCAGYDNGDIKLFDLRNMSLRWEKNIQNGVCCVEFDRKDINMNKLVATSLEGKFHVFDMRTQHPTKGFASVSEKAHKSSVWQVRHLPQNRDVFMTTGGAGNLHLWKYEYPAQRSKKDSDDVEMGVAGSVTLLQNKTLTSQPISSLDWSPDKQGLCVCTSFDQTVRVLIVTKLNRL